MYYKTIKLKLDQLETERLKRIKVIEKHLKHLSIYESNYVSRKHLLESELYCLKNLKILQEAS